MKPILLHILLITICLPQLGMAQSGDMESRDRFYEQLGIRDAKHEISIIAMNIEDESDFWKDQRAFEDLLIKESPTHYQSYINGKAEVYRQHKIHCGNRCGHSEKFSRQISFYIINGNPMVNGEVVFAPKAKTLKPKE